MTTFKMILNGKVCVSVLILIDQNGNLFFQDKNFNFLLKEVPRENLLAKPNVPNIDPNEPIDSAFAQTAIDTYEKVYYQKYEYGFVVPFECLTTSVALANKFESLEFKLFVGLIKQKSKKLESFNFEDISCDKERYFVKDREISSITCIITLLLEDYIKSLK